MEKKFARGIMWKDANPKAPAWVKGQIVIQPEFLKECLLENAEFASAKGWFTLDLKAPKNGGNYYLEINTFKPEKQPEQPKQAERNHPEDFAPINETTTYVDENGEEQTIPF